MKSAIVTVAMVMCLAMGEGQVQVNTKYGPVEGHSVDFSDGSYVNSFLSIPFAKPPNGTLRWKAPEEPDPWSLYVADELQSVCVQSVVGEILITHPGWRNFSEDCLHLNIFTPQVVILYGMDLNPAEPYPVMVWLHGGGFQSSANIQYPGHFLAKRGVVVVIPNYRLGIFGFASTRDENAPGNFGLLDQIQALRFVQENIANFGGDPQQVTIFGQSAGGVSVGLMMMSPLARGYFHSAILQSGSEMHSWAINTDDSDPLHWLNQVAAAHGCENEDVAAALDCLRDVGQWELFHTSCSGCRFSPVVDGNVLPATPAELRESGDFAQVPVLEGFTREDGFLYLPAGNRSDPGLDRDEFEVRMRIRAMALTSDAELQEDIYQALLFYFTPWPHIDDRQANLYEYGMMDTDLSFGLDQDRQAKLHTDYADTYFYVWGFRGEKFGDIIAEWKGAPHIIDIPYVFGHTDLDANPAVKNDSMMYDFPIEFTAEDMEYADFTMNLWTNFAKFGNPTPTPLDTPQGGQVTWSQFTNQELNYLYIANEAVEMRENYRQRDYAFWTFYIDQMLATEGPN